MGTMGAVAASETSRRGIWRQLGSNTLGFPKLPSPQLRPLRSSTALVDTGVCTKLPIALAFLTQRPTTTQQSAK
eukprot:1157711-Pelagomonas_calceolata.AAC.26